MSPSAASVARIVQAAQELVRLPNDMDVRTAFVRATFNHDRTAAVIAALAEQAAGAPKEPNA